MSGLLLRSCAVCLPGCVALLRWGWRRMSCGGWSSPRTQPCVRSGPVRGLQRLMRLQLGLRCWMVCVCVCVCDVSALRGAEADARVGEA